MSVLRDIGCKFGLHRWGPITGDIAGAHHECTYCGRVKRIDDGRPPDAHDKLGIHH